MHCKNYSVKIRNVYADCEKKLLSVLKKQNSQKNEKIFVYSVNPFVLFPVFPVDFVTFRYMTYSGKEKLVEIVPCVMRINLKLKKKKKSSSF